MPKDWFFSAFAHRAHRNEKSSQKFVAKKFFIERKYSRVSIVSGAQGKAACFTHTFWRLTRYFHTPPSLCSFIRSCLFRLMNRLGPALSDTFAGHARRYGGQRSQFRYCFTSILERAVPFATTQIRTNFLPPTVIAGDAIGPMKGYCELPVQPAFMNVVGC